MPFRDFKGSAHEAMAKVVKDLRTFGCQASKAVRVEQIKQGYGDAVCHVVDELLNLELYRREFQFLPPVMPPDDAEVEGDELEGGEEGALLGGRIETREVSEAPHGKATAEETKMNFYDPAMYADYQLEKEEEDQILEGKIDPIEWMKELDRVYGELDNIQKDVELNRVRGGDDLEECRRHTELIVDLCKEIKDTCGPDVRGVFARSAETLEDQLSFVRKHEQRINQHNAAAITQLNQITQRKKGLAQELRALIDVVKRQDFENKELQNKAKTLDHQYEEAVADIGGQRQLKRLKAALGALKQSLKDLTLNEGILSSTLFSCAARAKTGKHHLFDELDEPHPLKPKKHLLFGGSKEKL